jgi:ankyrin repeat protein
VDYVGGCPTAGLEESLAKVPETLDETYQRTLREIKEAKWEFAHRMFQFIAVAFRPLRAQELAELLAFDFKAGRIQKFHENWRLEDPVDAVLSTCSSLLVDSGDDFGKVIQFSHISAREFLTSARIAQASDFTSRRYHVSMTPAHTLAAKACLGILLHLKKDLVTSDSLEKFTFAEYAAEHWFEHARFEGVLQNVEDGIKQLFNPNKSHLAVCVWIHEPDLLTRQRNTRSERPSPLPGTPLHYAALWGLPSIVEFLVIRHSQDVRSRGFINNETPLHSALKNGRVVAARFLLDHGADVTAQDQDGETPLHLASSQGQPEIARILIKRGADMTSKNKDKSTPLHLAAQEGRVVVAGIVIDRGADVAARNRDGEIPLHLAARWGKPDVARVLIDRGSDMTSQNKDRSTPLHLAAQEGRVVVAGMLIEHGADVAAQNQDGENPLHLAARWGQPDIARILIDRGSDVTSENKDKATPLHLAAQEGRIKVVDMLIRGGAYVETRNQHEETPLHLALRWGWPDVARILVQHHADVTARNKDGSTPLHLVSSILPQSFRKSPQQYAEVARILLKRGADATDQDQDGLTAFDLASQQDGLVEVRCVLLEHSAESGVHGETN